MSDHRNGLPLICLENIQVRYRTPEGREFFALDSIRLDIRSGEYVAILGSSGSGKTTLSNVIGMLNRGYEGAYRLQGRAVGEETSREQSRIRSETFGFIFQDYVLLDHLTAIENVALALRYAPLSKNEIRKRAREKLMLVGLEGKFDHYPYQLSGGQKQRVGIARGLIKDPAVLIADEPTGALDPASRTEILSLLQDLNEQGITIITVTHSEADAQAAKRIIRVEKGRITSDRVQRNRIRFFGKNLDLTDADQVALRSQLVLQHLNIHYGIHREADFLTLPDRGLDDAHRISILSQVKPEWLQNPIIENRLYAWFGESDEMGQLMIAKSVIQATENPRRPSEKIQSCVETLFGRAWAEETAMFFLKHLDAFPVASLKPYLRLPFFFAHESREVRATAINLLKVPGLLTLEGQNALIHSALIDSDPRVRSNTLDHLYSENRIDLTVLRGIGLEKDASPRVRAVWAEILIRHGLREEAQIVLEQMLGASQRSEVLSAIWVLGKDTDFNLSKFLQERVPQSPVLLSYVDDILATYARAHAAIEEWRTPEDLAPRDEDEAPVRHLRIA